MKKICILLCILGGLAPAFTQTAGKITYVDGWVDIKSAGRTLEAFIGDNVRTGDSIVTGSDGTAILERDSSVVIHISPDTVFAVTEVEGTSGKETVMNTAAGSVKFRFSRLLGAEPRIRTPSMVAGVRGTEFTVWTSAEGATLIAVSSGEVAVEAQGATVSLVADEGVEVLPGKTPGNKFSLLGRPIDFRDWASRRMDEFLSDPMTVLRGLETRLEGYYREMKEIKGMYEDITAQLGPLREKLQTIRNQEGTESAIDFYNDSIRPLEYAQGRAYINLRYWALSAYSLKRHALSKTWLIIKTRYLKDPDVDVYRNFLDEYERMIKRFWNESEQYLSSLDI